MTISVILATYNRAALLRTCLASLRAQPFAPGDEVLVVDNGSTDKTPSVIEEAAAGFPVAMHRLLEPRPGKSYAVNRAVAIAHGDVLAFIDDDVTLDAQWLDALRAAMADPTTSLVGGPVLPRWERDAPRWLSTGARARGRLAAPLGLLDYGHDVTELGPRTALGANLAVRSEVMKAMGGFVAHLGKLRGTLLSGEDHDLCRRVQLAGLRAVYCPSAVVRHFVPAERMRVRYYLSWFYWSGITHAAMEGHAPSVGLVIGGIPLYLVKQAATATARTLAALGLGDTARAVDAALDIMFAAGYAAGRWELVPLPSRPSSAKPAGAQV